MQENIVPPSKAVKTEFREKLARTNFWLAEIRKIFNVRTEVAVNFHPIGFNGCGFISATNDTFSFCFYSNLPTSRNYFEIDGISCHFSASQNFEIKDLQNELLKINNIFDKMLTRNGENLFSQIKRFFLDIKISLEIDDRFEIGSFENPMTSKKLKEYFPEFENLKDKLLMNFSNSKLESYFQYMPPPLISNYGVEVIFEKPIFETEFIEKLKNIRFSLQNSYLGWNLQSKYIINNMEYLVEIKPRHF